jgi:hypothetical protein
MMDAEPDAGSRRAYLQGELAFVRDGDVIITTNYDTLAERTLMEEGRWSPGDGYGHHAQRNREAYEGPE